MDAHDHQNFEPLPSGEMLASCSCGWLHTCPTGGDAIAETAIHLADAFAH